jgi:hypothetical protein
MFLDRDDFEKFVDSLDVHLSPRLRKALGLNPKKKIKKLIGKVSGDIIVEYDRLVRMRDQLKKLTEEVEVARDTMWLHIKNELGREYKYLTYDDKTHEVFAIIEEEENATEI